MNLDAITVQDCIDMYEKKGRYAFVSNGKVVGFYDEKSAPDKAGHAQTVLL